MQRGSTAAARAELGASFAEDVRASQGKASPFAVPAVPGARGYRVSAGGLFGDNVYFADGNFLYLVGQGWSSRDKKPPTRAALIAAVQKCCRSNERAILPKARPPARNGTSAHTDQSASALPTRDSRSRTHPAESASALSADNQAVSPPSTVIAEPVM